MADKTFPGGINVGVGERSVALLGSVTGLQFSKPLDLSSLAGGSPNAALILGGGNAGVPLGDGAVAGRNFIEFRTKSTATSGDCRLAYLRQDFAAAGSGETLRAYSTVSGSVGVGGTVNGAHITLGLTGAASALNGQGFGLRVNFDAAAAVVAIGGSQSAVAMLETNIATGPTMPADLAFLRCNNLGAQKLDNLLSLTNPSTTMFADAGTGAGSAGAAGGSVCAKVLKIIVDGTAYYIGLNSTNAS